MKNKKNLWKEIENGLKELSFFQKIQGDGASGRTRTDMSLHSIDFESIASTNSTTEATLLLYLVYNDISMKNKGDCDE